GKFPAIPCAPSWKARAESNPMTRAKPLQLRARLRAGVISIRSALSPAWGCARQRTAMRRRTRFSKLSRRNAKPGPSRSRSPSRQRRRRRPQPMQSRARDGLGAAMTNEYTELARQAWKEAMGDAETAIWLLRNSTNLSLREALGLIQKIAAEVGG